MMPPRPLVLLPKPLLDLLLTILLFEPETLLIVCMSKISLVEKIFDSFSSTSNHLLLIPTLESIEKSSKMQVVYCDSIPILHGRLAVLTGQYRHLILFYPCTCITFGTNSAQALAKTMGLAVDASIKLGAQLILVEPILSLPNQDFFLDSKLEESLITNTMNLDPWEQHLPILNATSSRFGTDRGWVGRTISARRVIDRWCIWE